MGIRSREGLITFGICWGSPPPWKMTLGEGAELRSEFVALRPGEERRVVFSPKKRVCVFS